jgi:hypothetical protein
MKMQEAEQVTLVAPEEFSFEGFEGKPGLYTRVSAAIIKRM